MTAPPTCDQEVRAPSSRGNREPRWAPCALPAGHAGACAALRHPTRPTDADLRAAVAAGESDRVIGERYGVTRAMVGRWRKAADPPIEQPPAGSRRVDATDLRESLTVRLSPRERAQIVARQRPHEALAECLRRLALHAAEREAATE